jgi:hypothetical protein
MRPALKAALDRIRAVLLAAVAGGAAPLGGHAHAAIEAGQPAVGADEQQSWADARQRNTVQAFQRYLELYPTGQYAEEAFRSLIERSFRTVPVPRLVDIEPALGAAGPGVERAVPAISLALY